MYGMFNLVDKVKRYFAFSKEEVKSLVIAILILGFVVGFDDGQETFQFAFWLKNLFASILIVALAILAREIGHRVYALQTGQKSEIKLWWFGLITALMLSIISFGKIMLLVYGGIIVHFMKRHRIGYFRQWQGIGDMGIIALMGSLANLALAFVFKVFMFLPNNQFIQKAILVNAIMASLNMLPIPPLDGSMLLFASRVGYVLAFVLIVAASVLLVVVTSIPLALLGSVVIGAILWFLYLIKVENK